MLSVSGGPLHYPTAADICKLFYSNSSHGATRKLVAANFNLVSSYIPQPPKLEKLSI